MKLNKRLAATIAVLSTLSVLMLGVVAFPTILSIRNLQADIEQEYLKIEEQYLMRNHTRASLKTLENIRPVMEKLSGMVIIEGKELKFINALEDIATQTNVSQSLSLETVNQKEVAPEEKNIPVKIKIVGNYDSILYYLEKIHSLPYYITVNSLSIDPLVLTKVLYSKSGKIQAEINGTVRWFSKKHSLLNHTVL